MTSPQAPGPSFTQLSAENPFFAIFSPHFTRHPLSQPSTLVTTFQLKVKRARNYADYKENV